MTSSLVADTLREGGRVLPKPPTIFKTAARCRKCADPIVDEVWFKCRWTTMCHYAMLQYEWQARYGDAARQ